MQRFAEEDKGNGKGKGEIRGSLHCATDDETVRRFGRDDGCLWWWDDGCLWRVEGERRTVLGERFGR